MKNSKYLFLMTLLFLGFFIDLMMPFVLGVSYPGYSHLMDTISTLGTDVSPVKFGARLSLVIVGALYSLSAFGHFYQFVKTGKYERLYFLGILLFGIGTIIAGVFPEDPKGIITETIRAKVHGIASFTGFVFLTLCPLWATKIKQFKTDKRLNYFLFIMSIITFLIFIFSNNIEEGVFKYTGLYQRINLATLYLSLIINYRNFRL